MGYACPVCSTPQADGEHLANHLAFTALLHGDDHAAWLDEHVPDWSERDPEGLASAVVPRVEEVDVEGAPDPEDAIDGSTVPDRPFEPPARDGRDVTERAPVDPETRRIVERARELTRRMRSGVDRSGDDREE